MGTGDKSWKALDAGLLKEIHDNHVSGRHLAVQTSKAILSGIRDSNTRTSCQVLQLTAEITGNGPREAVASSPVTSSSSSRRGTAPKFPLSDSSDFPVFHKDVFCHLDNAR